MLPSAPCDPATMPPAEMAERLYMRLTSAQARRIKEQAVRIRGQYVARLGRLAGPSAPPP